MNQSPYYTLSPPSAPQQQTKPQPGPPPQFRSQHGAKQTVVATRAHQSAAAGVAGVSIILITFLMLYFSWYYHEEIDLFILFVLTTMLIIQFAAFVPDTGRVKTYQQHPQKDYHTPQYACHSAQPAYRYYNQYPQPLYTNEYPPFAQNPIPTYVGGNTHQG